MSNQPNNERAAPEARNSDGFHLPAPVDARRRRLTTAGLAASGVILSMASRSTLAGAVSHGSIHSHVATTKLLGESPAYWIAQADAGGWSEASGVACDARYGAVFHQCSAGAGQAELTLLQSLKAEHGGPQAELGQLVAAAYLNTVSGKSAAHLTLAQVHQMASGAYTPAVGGVTWDQQKVIAFLKLTMNASA